MKDNRYWAAALYCTVVDCLLWGGTGYAVFVLGHSGWWFALTLVASASVGLPEGARSESINTPRSLS